MDPLSIAGAASGLVFSVVRNGRDLATVFEKYQDSQRCVFLMQTECTVLAAALSQLQMFFSKLPKAAMDRYPSFVLEAIDLSLTGCTLTMSVLSKEINGLVENAGDSPVQMLKRKKLKYLWKDESMSDLLQQLRGQSSALSLLLKALDSVSMDQILSIVQSGQNTFQKVRSDAASLRQKYPDEKYAESIVDMVFDDTKTIYSLEVIKPPNGHQAEDIVAADLEKVNLSPSPSPSAARGLPEGWKAVYNPEYDEWFYVNTVTRKSQWERPNSVALTSEGNENSKSQQSSLSKPASSSRASLPMPTSAVKLSAGVSRSSSRKTSEHKIFENDLDFAPWKLNTDDKFQAALDSLRIEAAVPALAVGVVSATAPNKVYVVGKRKQGCATPVTRMDCFSIANTNVFTTTVLASLVHRGVFRWEETVADLFPSFALRIHPFHLQTTLEMLGAHYSGFTTQPFQAEDGDLYRYLRQVSATKGRSAVALSYLGRPPETAPGTSFCWNWANTVLIALAVEERTSRSLHALIKTLIFDPLEMYSAGFGQPDAARNSSQPGKPTQPWGHEDESKNPRDPTRSNTFQPPALDSSVGIYCSMPDFASFVRMHLRGAMGLPSQGTPKLSERLYSKYTSTSSALGSWGTPSRDWAGGETLMENGRCDGFGYSCWLAPLQGKAYFAVANVDGDSGLNITDQAVALSIRHAAG